MRQSPGLSSSEVAGNICGISRALGPACQYPMWGVGGGKERMKGMNADDKPLQEQSQT